MPLALYRRPGSKIWHYRGTAAGRRLRRSTGTTDKKTAQRIAAKAETDAWERRLNAKGANLTMAQAFIAYLDAGKDDRFIAAIASYWKDTAVADVTATGIHLSARKIYPNASNATRNRQVIAPTQAAINFCAGLDWCSPIKVSRLTVAAKTKTPVTTEWVAAFQAEASPHMGALCRFMFETGARLGEAVALTWDDVNLANRTAIIRQTKVSRERVSRITPNILTAIANIPSNRQPSEPVFGYASRDSVGQTWRKIAERAGIEPLSPHSCRHGFATTMLRKGRDPKTVAHWGGWSDVRILLETYAHAITDPNVVDDAFDTHVAQDNFQDTVSHSKGRKNWQ